MRGLGPLALAVLVAPSPALASGPAVGLGIDGDYDSPLGRVRVAGDGVTYRGVLIQPAAPCTFGAGDEVLRATLLDDSLAGQVRVCLSGKACRSSEQWASAVLLVQGAKLSGAVHVSEKGCAGPVGKRGGIAFTRRERPAEPPVAGNSVAPGTTAMTTSTPTSTATPTRAGTPTRTRAARERARAILRDGAAYLHEGNFEAARRRFLDAIQVDPKIPESYNGVGVTFRMRNDLAQALDWYKKALAVDPDFGDAYYNMACVYALRGEKQMALRYLQIAALNGYATAEGIGGDPDLDSVRAEPAYRALVQARM